MARFRDLLRRSAGWRVSAALLIGAPLLGGCEQESSAQASPQGPPAVTVARPLVKNIVEWDEFTGRFEPVESVEVRARVSGHLQSVHFKDGQIVEQGQLLFVIDPRPFEVAVDEARADVDSARARFELATLELDRVQRLLGSSALAQSTFDQRMQEKRSAEAAVAAAEARLRNAALDLGYTQITSPIKGRASNRRVDVGNLVTEGSEGSAPLTTVVSLDPIHFVFDASEADYLRYQRLAREGKRRSSRETANPVFVRLADEQGWPRAGKMDFVDNIVDRSTGTIRAHAVFANPDLQLTPGVFGRLRLFGSGEYEAVLIPDDAVLADQASKIVLTVTDANVVQPRPVTVGPLVEGLRVIRDGLGGTDRIVINGLLRARPGAKVAPQEGKIEPAPEPTAS